LGQKQKEKSHVNPNTMRLKILSLFLVIQVLSFAVWTTLNEVEASPVEPTAHAQVHPAPADLGDLNFQARNMDEGKRFLNSIKQNQIETVLQKMPTEHVATVQNIILDYNTFAHRGLGGNSMIILRAVNMSTQELMGVLIHEMAHNVDYGFLDNSESRVASNFKDGSLTLYESDPSLDFYRISWRDNETRVKTAGNTDFVSGYAMSDPFEDFAETYAFYVLHNKDFKVLASSSDVLLQKYQFMKHQVFDGEEFDTGDGEIDTLKRPWDITVLSYDVFQFLS